MHRNKVKWLMSCRGYLCPVIGSVNDNSSFSLHQSQPLILIFGKVRTGLCQFYRLLIDCENVCLCNKRQATQASFFSLGKNRLENGIEWQSVFAITRIAHGFAVPPTVPPTASDLQKTCKAQPTAV